MEGRTLFRLNFHVSVFLLLSAVVIISTFGAMVSVFQSSAGAAREEAAAQFEAIAGRVQDRVERHVRETLDLASVGAAMGVASAPITGDGMGHPMLPFMIDTLERRPSVYSLYIGRDNGDFLQVIGTGGHSRVLSRHNAPQDTRMIVRAISGAGADRHEIWTFLGKDRRRLGGFVNESPDYDPRKRQWYESAQGTSEAILSEPYVFFSLQSPGVSGVRHLLDGPGVFGVDLWLGSLASFVQTLRISPGGGVVLLDKAERVLATRKGFLGGEVSPLMTLDGKSEVGRAVLAALEKPTGQVIRYEDGPRGPWMVRQGHWRGGGTGAEMIVVVAAPLADFTARFEAMLGRMIIVGTVIMALVVPMAILVSRRMSVALGRLVREAEHIRAFDFSERPIRSSIIHEFQDLGQAFGLMRRTLAERTDALELEQAKLERLVNQGIAMAGERDGVKLMEMILDGARDLTNADGGTLYIRDGDVLRFQIMRNDTLSIALGGVGEPPCDIPAVSLLTADGLPNHANVVSHCVHAEKMVNIADAYDATGFDFSGTRVFDERNGYRSTSFLTVPLKPRGGEVIGALQLINARTADGTVVPFADDIQSMIEALAAQAGTLMDNQGLLRSQERLMDSMIRIVAGAIDAKSPYTGSHCERVPELALMLAEAASDERTGTLGDFSFETDAEWREFRIGAWLHDCGKMVTPEYVVDKATKLETIYNRIHEVRTRFEVLHRDATIAYLQGVIAGDRPKPELRAEMEARHVALGEDFAFVAECNIGGETMEPARVVRLKEIATTSWQRHFDDRLGLSQAEEARRAGEAPAPLPATEALLADKSWHVLPRPGGRHAYDAYDFKVEVPENLYDFGELYNLCIERGTLTPEERFKINEHIMQTIVMLDEMPFPAHLRRVPEYAGTHHETLTGTGYPRCLTRNDLSVPARIMAIADIFEALTAADRPYKRAKTLSESIAILSGFRDREHIDADLFDLFLTSGVYRRYAERFLHPEQIDEVDITAFLSPGTPVAD